MTVGELRDLLEDEDDDMEVRLATQRAWAFQYAVEVALVVEVPDSDSGIPDADPIEIFYIAESEQLGYLPTAVSEHLGWG